MVTDEAADRADTAQILDTLGMFEVTASLPEQVEAAIDAGDIVVRRTALPHPVLPWRQRLAAHALRSYDAKRTGGAQL